MYKSVLKFKAKFTPTHLNSPSLFHTTFVNLYILYKSRPDVGNHDNMNAQTTRTVRLGIIRIKSWSSKNTLFVEINKSIIFKNNLIILMK